MVIAMTKINKYFIIGAIILLLILIISVTTFKVIKKHNDKVLLVESKYIIEQAKKCYNEKKCNSDKITLKELYNLNYLDKQVNGVTKEYYNENSYVQIDSNNYKFIIES